MPRKVIALMKKLICTSTKLFLFLLSFAILISSATACTPDSGSPSESSPSDSSSNIESSSSPEESTPESSDEPTESPTESETEPEPEPEPETITLKIGSYNIANGGGADHVPNLGADIKNKGLDIVGIQEVDQFANRTGNVDTMKLLSESSGLPYYTFFRAIGIPGGSYGVGVLSRYPIVSDSITKLYSWQEGHEARVLGLAVIDVNGTKINFFVTHLSYESKTARDKQFAEIGRAVEGLDNFIITGDFNTSDFKEYSPIKDSDMVNNSTHSIKTFPSPTPTSSIDNIVFSKNDWEFGTPAVLPNGKSDHCMLYATGTFTPN